MGFSELLAILPIFKDQPFLQLLVTAGILGLVFYAIKTAAKDKAAATSADMAPESMIHMQGPLAVTIAAVTEMRDIQREVRDAAREGRDILKEMRDLTRSNNEALREGRDRQARMVEILDDISREQIRHGPTR